VFGHLICHDVRLCFTDGACGGFVGAGSELRWDRSREWGGSRRGSVCFGAVARDVGNRFAGSGVVHDPVRRVQ
jgi:hypothetical protein